MAQQKYWKVEGYYVNEGVAIELRAALAWQLIGHFALVTGKAEGEDSTGRQKFDSMPAKELVARAFAIVDEYIESAEAREELRAPSQTIEEALKEEARLGDIKTDLELGRYERSSEKRMKAKTEKETV